LTLAISSSTNVFSAGIIDNDKVLCSVYFREKKVQDKILKVIDFIRSFVDDIDSLAVDIGPGGFTGLRIGLSVIKTISFVKKIPIYTAYSLDLIRANTISNKVISGIDANGRIFVRVYDSNVSDIFDIKVEDLVNMINEKKLDDYELIGDGFIKYDSYFKSLKINNIFYFPTIESFPKVWHGPYDYSILPYYGRKSQAEEKLWLFLV